MVNVNIEIPEELHRQLKLASVLQGTTLKDYIIGAIDKRVPPEKKAVKEAQRAAKKAEGS